MLKSGRPLVAAAVLSLVVQAGVASAQTVIARKAPAGSTVELVLNTTKVGTRHRRCRRRRQAPVHPRRSTAASWRWTRPSTSTSARTSAASSSSIATWRRPRRTPAARARTSSACSGCGSVTNLVVDTGSVNATVFLRQGPVDLTQKGPKAQWSSTPTGLIVFGGAGLGRVPRRIRQLSAGTARPCNGDDTHTTYVAGGNVLVWPVHRRRGRLAEAHWRQRERRRLELPLQQRPELVPLRDQRQGRASRSAR